MEFTCRPSVPTFLRQSSEPFVPGVSLCLAVFHSFPLFPIVFPQFTVSLWPETRPQLRIYRSKSDRIDEITHRSYNNSKPLTSVLGLQQRNRTIPFRAAN